MSSQPPGNRTLPAQSKTLRRPERVCGHWREYLSTNGRPYYYNTRTRVNRWEKPEGWNLPDRNHSQGRPGHNRDENGRPNHHRHREKTKLTKNLLKTITTMSNQISTETSRDPASARDSSNPSSGAPPPFGSIKTLSSEHNTTTTTSISALSGGTPVKSSHAGPKKKWLGQAAVINTETKVQNNGIGQVPSQLNPLFNRKRRNRVDDFKRMIEEIPKLPDMSDFEALRPFTDNNLISEDVRKLTHEPNEKQILDMIPSKTKLQNKLSYNATKLKSLRANVRRHQVMRSYLDNRLSNYRSEMKILIEGGSSLTNSSATPRTLH